MAIISCWCYCYYCNEVCELRYLDDFSAAVQEKLDADNDSSDHHGSDHCACHGDDHVFPGNTWLLAVATGLHLKWYKQNNSQWRRYYQTCKIGLNCNVQLLMAHVGYVEYRYFMLNNVNNFFNACTSSASSSSSAYSLIDRCQTVAATATIRVTHAVWIQQKSWSK